MFTIRHRCRRDDALRRLGNDNKQTVVNEGRSDRSTFVFESGCGRSEVHEVARPSPILTRSLFHRRRRRTAHPPNLTSIAEGSGDCAEMAIVMTDLTCSDSLGSSGGRLIVC
jgi:hypothetical protein